MEKTIDKRQIPTLADVARRANVSTATVSRCLNQPDQVVEKTRDRVMIAVAELGYAPNFGAQALAAKQTNTVGAVIPTMENALFAGGTQAFQEELGRHGKTLLVASSSYQPELEDSQVRTLVARGADALLLVGYDRDASLYDFLEKRGVPTLIAWNYQADRKVPAVGCDNVQGMVSLTELVLARGHRNIACISAPIDVNDRARARVDGIRRALTPAGLDADALYLIETPYDVENGERALRQVLTDAPETTAVMCGNDVLAVGALRAAKDMGLRVPNDISITGFDDLDIAQLAEPALTTVYVPRREMGRRAAQMLIQMLNGGGAVDSQELATEIRLRRSLGDAP